MLHAGMDAQLVNSRPYAGHGLPIIRLKPCLHEVQLMAGYAPRVPREASQILKGGAYPEEPLHGCERVYNFLYAVDKNTRRRTRRSGAWLTPLLDSQNVTRLQLLSGERDVGSWVETTTVSSVGDRKAEVKRQSLGRFRGDWGTIEAALA
jgi:hypothetical protein